MCDKWRTVTRLAQNCNAQNLYSVATVQEIQKKHTLWSQKQSEWCRLLMALLWISWLVTPWMGVAWLTQVCLPWQCTAVAALCYRCNVSNTSSVKLFGAQCVVQTVHTHTLTLSRWTWNCFAQYPAKFWVFGRCQSSQCVVPLWYDICMHTSSYLVLRLGRPGGYLSFASFLLLSKTLNHILTRLRDLTRVLYTPTYCLQISTGSTPFVGKSRISPYFDIW